MSLLSVMNSFPRKRFLAFITFSLTVIFPLAACADERIADRNALVALYHATDGVNWRDNTNWTSDSPLSEWYGVATDDSGRVTELILDDNQLSGEIPPELGSLTSLQALALSANRLSGEIPSELGNLTGLVWLRLSANRLSGKIPSGLGNLDILEWLGLSDNELTGCIPDSLRYVPYNDFANAGLLFCGGGVIDSTSDRNALVALYHATDGPNWSHNANWMGDSPLSEWRGVATDDSGRVIELNLWNNNLVGRIPPELGDLTRLERLNLWGNGLVGQIPPELGNLTRLERLYLSDNELTGCIPDSLRDVHYHDFSDTSLSFCGDAP